MDRPTNEWVRGTLPRAGTIYPDDARLWLTLQLLTKPDLIPGRLATGPLVPERDLKLLIEAVYAPSEAIVAAVPPQLHGRHFSATGAALGAVERGRDNRLSFVRGLLEDWAGGSAQPESDAERLPTRLGDSLRAILLERNGPSLRFIAAGTDSDVLDQSECRCPRRLRPTSLADADLTVLAQGLPRSARERLKATPAIILVRQADGAFRSDVAVEGQRTCTVQYHRTKGLMLV